MARRRAKPTTQPRYDPGRDEWLIAEHDPHLWNVYDADTLLAVYRQDELPVAIFFDQVEAFTYVAAHQTLWRAPTAVWFSDRADAERAEERGHEWYADARWVSDFHAAWIPEALHQFLPPPARANPARKRFRVRVNPLDPETGEWRRAAWQVPDHEWAVTMEEKMSDEDGMGRFYLACGLGGMNHALVLPIYFAGDENGMFRAGFTYVAGRQLFRRAAEGVWMSKLILGELHEDEIYGDLIQDVVGETDAWRFDDFHAYWFPWDMAVASGLPPPPELPALPPDVPAALAPARPRYRGLPEGERFAPPMIEAPLPVRQLESGEPRRGLLARLFGGRA